MNNVLHNATDVYKQLLFALTNLNLRNKIVNAAILSKLKQKQSILVDADL